MTYRGLQLRVYNMLNGVVWARERSRKDEALIKLLTNRKQWDGEIAAFRMSELVELAKDYASADRAWRKILEENPALRGRDYDEKTVLMQKKVLDLGYEVGFDANRKKLGTVNA